MKRIFGALAFLVILTSVSFAAECNMAYKIAALDSNGSTQYNIVEKIARGYIYAIVVVPISISRSCLQL